ncbi:MAG: cyanase [Filomicrobium sp.]
MTMAMVETQAPQPGKLLSSLEMTEAIMVAKVTKGVTWSQIAAAAGFSEVFVTSACLGQNSMPADAAKKLVAFLGLGPEVEFALQSCPKKAQTADSVSKDPLIYRFHEITFVYGDTIKELIHEKFGDGIMSAIDFDMSIDKVENPKGDRVKVTMTGKFLAYNKW